MAERQLGLPRISALKGNFPNPCNAATTLSYQIGEPGRVRLAIFDASGQRVVMLVDAQVQTGLYEVRWDGRDDPGQFVATGVYLSRLQTREGTSVRKMLLLK